MAESNSQPVICPCGFFGSAQTLGLCSKCYRESSQLREQRSVFSASDLRSHNNYNTSSDNNNDDYNNDNFNSNCNNNSRSTDDDDDDDDDEEEEDDDDYENLATADLSSSSSSSFIFPESSLQASSSSPLNNPISAAPIPSIPAVSYAMIQKNTTKNNDDDTDPIVNKSDENTPPLFTSSSSPTTPSPNKQHSRPQLPTTTTATNVEATQTTTAPTDTTSPVKNPLKNEPSDKATIKGTTKDLTEATPLSSSPPSPPSSPSLHKSRLFPRPKSDSMLGKSLKRKYPEAFLLDESSNASTSSLVEGPSPSKSTRRKKCYVCNAKLDLALQTIGRCKCEFSFCSMHRLPEQHECSFDHKESSRMEARSKMVVFKKHMGTALKRLDNDF